MKGPTGVLSATGEPGESWMVVWTEARAEKRVESRIAAKGLVSWLPTIVERRKWSDRWQRVVLPLFPGYLFVQGRLTQLADVLATPGVLTVIKTGTRPALLSEEFIVSLRRAVGSPEHDPRPVLDTPRFDIADEVVVGDGPLAGLRGVVQEVQGSRRLIVWVEQLGRGVAFTVQPSSLAHA